MFRIGIGFDAHRFAANRKLMLGGVEIPHSHGLQGHSDADVLLHALADALLGAAGLGDIGTHFPDSDPKWKGAASGDFITAILQLITRYTIANVDMTLIAEVPKISSHKSRITGSVSKLLDISEERVNLKATTTDHMGFIGREEGIAAQAVVLLNFDE